MIVIHFGPIRSPLLRDKRKGTLVDKGCRRDCAPYSGGPTHITKLHAGAEVKTAEGVAARGDMRLCIPERSR